MKKWKEYGKSLPFGVAILDAHNPENQNSNSATKFAWGLKAGTNIWVSEKVGIKTSGATVERGPVGRGTLYVGTGRRRGGGVATYSSMLQFSLGGGLCFRLGSSSAAHTGPK